MKRFTLFFAALITILTMTVFAGGLKFTDVKESDWFYSDVVSTVEMGLINGKGDSTYCPNDNLTYAEAVKLAACMHEKYTTGKITLQNGEPWYKPYFDYCSENHIINKKYESFPFNDIATRSGYMEIFANALPAEALEPINYIPDDSIPDVLISEAFGSHVYKLYRAGIVAGSDAEHRCKPSSNIKRSEVATILSRMMNKEKRVSFSMRHEEQNPTPSDIYSERTTVSDDLPEADFKGKKLRIVSHKTDEYYINDESINKGDLLIDAKYNRNKTVEDRFNFKIEVAYQADYPDVNAWVTRSVLSGLDEFDLFCSHSASAGSAVLKNVFLNWYDIPYIDFSKPWWSSDCADDLTYDGKCILAVSDFNYTAVSLTQAIFFNKTLVNAYDMDDIYEVVLRGDWTFDYFVELTKDIYIDMDESGDKSDGDFYGFAQPHNFQMGPTTWMWAFDNPTVKKDDEGIPQIAINTDKINGIVKGLYDYLFNTNGVHYTSNDKAVQGMELFLDRKTIFAMGDVEYLTSNRLHDFEDEYGILPLPKWDKTQRSYYTMSPGEHTILAVPKTTPDTEFVGIVVEALSAESYKQIIPALYEVAFGTKYLQDSKDREMLDIIIDGRVYDFGYVYGGFQGFNYAIGAMFKSNNNKFNTYYSKKYAAARLHYKKIIKVFDKLG